MAIFYRVAADVVVVIHMAYVLAVVLGLPAIWLGIVLKHRWILNPWIRCGHLAMILIVVGEAWAGITCPLTTWEHQLREAAGGESYRGAFVANLVHNLLFYDFEPWVFTLLYTGFGILVVASFLIAPPHWKRLADKAPEQDPSADLTERSPSKTSPSENGSSSSGTKSTATSPK